MKKLLSLILMSITLMTLTSCGSEQAVTEPEEAQMHAICELATTDCYYHNVAKYNIKNAEKYFFFFTKDKNLWIEYDGIVTVGVDASRVEMTVSGEKVKITIPPAKVLYCKVNDDTLNKDSFIVEKNSAAITAADQTEAFRIAQEDMEKTVSQNAALLTNAQQRAQTLLENYVNNIGTKIGKKYQIEWVYLDKK